MKKLVYGVEDKRYRVFVFLFFTVLYALCPAPCFSAYDYISEKLHYGNIYYPAGDFEEGQKYPVVVQNTARQLLLDSESEFNYLKSNRKYFYEKSAEIFALNVIGFSLPSDSIQIYLKKKKYAEQDFMINSVFFLLNTKKIFVADNEIAIDTHLHTIHSHDSVSDIEKLIIHANKKGLSAIAITDHNDYQTKDIVEKLKVRGLIKKDFFVISGEEISTVDGHIVALFIKTHIHQNMSVDETIAEIHRQNGLAIAAHPTQKSGVGLKQSYSQKFDGVELYNGSSFLPYDFFRQTKIKKKLRKQKKFYLSSSDSHFKNGVGYSGYSIVKVGEKSLNGIKEAMENGDVRPVLSGVYLPYKSLIEFKAIQSIYSTLSLYDDIKDNVEFLFSKIIFSSLPVGYRAGNVKICTTYDEQVYNVLNVIGVKSLFDKNSELKKSIKISSVSATYGPAIFGYDFNIKETTIVAKFMF
ncbi:MAG: PHP domain-containing protein [Elusimicrobiota bacterium]